MIDLKEVREQIDRTDAEIVRLFEERMDLTEKVARYKISTGKPVYDRERELDKLKRIGELASCEFNAIGVREVLQQMMSIGKRRQYQMLAENGVTYREDYIQKDHLEFPGEKVVFQGLEGAYTYAAMKEFFEQKMDFCHVKTWREAMEMVASGEMDWGVFPIENSTAGSVSDVYDLLIEYPIYIVGEQIIPICHALLGVPGTKLEDVTTVYSHPQALAQCKKYLEEHYPDWKQEEMLNTAIAAEKIANDGDKTHIAIASKYAAERFGLEILQNGGMTGRTNSTRFVIISHRKEFREDAKRLSLSFELPHSSGSLYNILAHFIYNGLNMTRIKSRPIPGKPWEYRFYVDVDGNLSDPAVKNALLGIQSEASSFRLLGNY